MEETKRTTIKMPLRLHQLVQIRAIERSEQLNDALIRVIAAAYEETEPPRAAKKRRREQARA